MNVTTENYTLIILHGWGQNRSDWKQFLDSIQQDISTIIIEFPGFGNEPLVSEEWGIPEYAKWTKEQLLKIEGNKILLGHSFGGRIASYIASENPEWLKSIILYGAPCLYRPSLKVKLKIMRNKLFRKLGLKRSRSSNNTDLYIADKNSMGKIFRKVVPFDQTAILSQIRFPTLLVWGEYDTAAPIRIAKEIEHLIPQSNLVIIDGAGHNAHQEKPHLFYGIIKNFIKTL